VSKRSDASAKQTMDQTAEAWVRWLLSDQGIVVEASLSTEFQFVARLSDSLLQVRGREGRFLVLTEIQLRYDPEMPRRMRAYTALAEEKYRQAVYPIVVYLLPPPPGTEIAEQFHREFMGLVAHQDYRVVKVWEQDPWEVIRSGLLTLVPFVPLMRDADEAAIRAGAELIRRQPGLEELETVLALFASFRLEPEQVKRMLRWEMAVLRESPWYQEILEVGRREGLEMGLETGRREGLEAGRREGLREGRRQSLLDFLAYRFGQVPERIRTGLSGRSLAELNALFDAAMDADSLDDFEARLTALDREQV